MDISQLLLFTFTTSFICLFVLRKLAKRVNLVDVPSERKLHEGAIPLVGGVSIYISLLVVFAQYFQFTDIMEIYFLCATTLVVIGVWDDRFDMSFKIRLLIQFALSFFIVFGAEKSLNYFGYFIGNFPVHLNIWPGAFVTAIAVTASINAFNMVDGIDGLLGGLASVTFGALALMFAIHGDEHNSTICGVIVVAMVPYILLNLGIPFGRRYKVFMGDAGSMLIGFTVIWMLINATQDQNSVAMKPVTALWVIAIPLMDMATIMIRRVRKGVSPFKPDREHLHHICQRAGLSEKCSLAIICSISCVMAVIGIIADLSNIPEWISFLSFLIVFIVYFSVICYIWRILTFLRRLSGKSQKETETISRTNTARKSVQQ